MWHPLKHTYSLTHLVRCLIILCSLLTTPWMLVAQDDGLSIKEMLLTPGKLTQAHAKFENECESCHVHFDKSSQTNLCLACHETIAEDLNTQAGYHGKTTTVSNQECRYCHTDHKGRDKDITQLVEEMFNHQQTNFQLEGAHQNIACHSCHHADETTESNSAFLLPKLPQSKGYRFEAYQCQNCHEDVHNEKLGSQCQDCHTSDNWSPEAFDHNQTDFQLEGAHTGLVCGACHRSEIQVELSTECNSCHLSDDAHLGLFGTKCLDCHTQEKWQPQSFDHMDKTGFELKHKHLGSLEQPVACLSCHSEEKNPPVECSSCHLSDDVHQGTNGQECQSCHSEKGWEFGEFNHDIKTTGFEIDGAHIQVKCESCHLPGSEYLPDKSIPEARTCDACHLAINPHGKLMNANCDSCHITTGWAGEVLFSHDFSSFPLTGSHQLLSCASCHADLNYKNTEKDCHSCHKTDDRHEASLGTRCESCHDTATWQHWRFDHTKQTKFELLGAHRDRKCQICHNKNWPEPLKPARDCYSCHKQDDIHLGGFGTACSDCHSETTFSLD